MNIKCKLCGKTISSMDNMMGGFKLNIESDNEMGSKLAEMSENLVALINHLMIAHPEKAMELYGDLSSKLSSIFEMSEDKDFTIE